MTAAPLYGLLGPVLGEQPRPKPVIDFPIQVLLVEDNPEHAEWITFLLSQDCGEGFEVEWAGGLIDAMIRLSTPGIDVILLDLGMPEMEGHRSYAAIRAAAPGTPVIILTGDDSPVSRRCTLCGGAQDYLVKDTISGTHLRRVLRRACRMGKDRSR